MNILPILIMVAVIVFAMMIGPPLLRWVRSVVTTSDIRNEKARRMADSALYSGTYTLIFTAAFFVLGMPYSLGNILLVFLVMMLLNYFMPTQR